MKKVLITGMSGTGKSTLVAALTARGYRGIDMDEPGWSEYRTVAAGPDAPSGGPEWVWREDRVRELLAADDGDVLFVGGCASNQWQFYGDFDHIILLSAPVPLMVERLATRTTNPFGKGPGELARILEDQRTIEPLLRRVATAELVTTAPADDLVDAILAIAGEADA